jgi:hypothetical protein
MKISINILPDGQKEKREVEKKIGEISRFGFSLVFAFLVLLSVLFSARLVLGIDYKSVQETVGNRPGNSEEDIKQTENLLSEINNISKKINKISEETPRWSKVLKKIADTPSSDLRITLIHVEKEHVKLDGFGKNRDPYFQDFLDKLDPDDFKNINSPDSNVVSKKDFNFEIEMDVDSKYLNQD